MPEFSLVERAVGRIGPRGLHDALSPEQRRAIPFVWPAWARPNQLLPEGDWTTAIALCGRGFGKTRMGTEWIRGIAERVPGARLAMMGETANAARKVLGFGPSGLVAVCPPWNQPRWSVMDQAFYWGNGSVAFLLSSEAPDGPRGHEFNAALMDEAAAYHRTNLPDCVSNLRLALRRGAKPQLLITTTPRPIRFLRELAKGPSTIVIKGSTLDNAANLPPSFLEDIRTQYGGTSLYRQEVEGVLLDEIDGAIVKRAWIDKWRVKTAPPLRRIMVGVDPSFSERKAVAHDEAGIVTVGVDASGIGYVLADDSLTTTPDQWARALSRVFHREKASGVVFESNRRRDALEADRSGAPPEGPGDGRRKADALGACRRPPRERPPSVRGRTARARRRARRVRSREPGAGRAR
jgi:phage terminase large subunit-like protein